MWGGASEDARVLRVGHGELPLSLLAAPSVPSSEGVCGLTRLSEAVRAEPSDVHHQQLIKGLGAAPSYFQGISGDR